MDERSETLYEPELEVHNWFIFKGISVITFIVFSLQGTVSNVLIIGGILMNKKLKILNNIFVIHLAASDMIMTTIYCPIATLILIGGPNLLPRSICNLNGALYILSAYNSLQSLACIAVERYFAICHNSAYKTHYNWKFVSVFLFYIYATVSGVIFTTAFWFPGDLDYDTRNALCFYRQIYTSFWILCIYCGWGAFLPMFTCFYCYLRIFLTVRSSKKRVGVHEEKDKGTKKAEVQLYMTLFIVFALFVACWAPFLVCILFANAKFHIPFEVYCITSYLSISNSVVNFIIYGFTNKQYRIGYNYFIKRIFCPKKLALEMMSESSNVKK